MSKLVFTLFCFRVNRDYLNWGMTLNNVDIFKFLLQYFTKFMENEMER